MVMLSHLLDSARPETLLTTSENDDTYTGSDIDTDTNDNDNGREAANVESSSSSTVEQLSRVYLRGEETSRFEAYLEQISSNNSDDIIHSLCTRWILNRTIAIMEEDMSTREEAEEKGPHEESCSTRTDFTYCT